VEVSGLIKVKKWILGIGSFAQVIAFKGLRQEIEEEITVIKKRYNKK